MERTEKDTSPLSRFLPPVPASYTPSRSVTKIPADSSVNEILAVLERDGCVILPDYFPTEVMDKIDSELEPHIGPIAASDGYDNFFGKKTLVIPGLVSKSDTIAKILDTDKNIDQLLKILLEERYPAVFEHTDEEICTPPLLSIALSFNVKHGSNRQSLHRDDLIFATKHPRGMKITEQNGFSMFIAQSNICRENGGTMVILGSHKWEHERRGTPEEVCFLEMERGSAFILLSSLSHGAGYNTNPGEIRKIINLVFCRGTLRTEENQFLCNPKSKVLKMSPKLQTLLGFRKPAVNWLGMVENRCPTEDLAAIYERVVS